MSDAEDLDFVALEQRLPGDLAAWEAAALQFAIGVHDTLVREDLTSREAFCALCGDRYCAACEYKDGVPAGADYVVCMSEEEAERCVPMAGPDVTPLLTFQPHVSIFSPLWRAQRLAFSFTDDEIQMDFASRFQQLTSVDFSGVRGVTAIDSAFMRECSNLRTFDFAPFKGVLRIGDECLAHCALTDVNLRGLENLRTVGTGFIHGCNSLEALDLSPLRSLEFIGAGFLAYTKLSPEEVERALRASNPTLDSGIHQYSMHILLDGQSWLDWHCDDCDVPSSPSPADYDDYYDYTDLYAHDTNFDDEYY